MSEIENAPVATPQIYCKQCDYLLIGLHENRCPECGRAFNPSNPETFETRDRTVRRRSIAYRSIPWVGFGILIVTLILFGIIRHRSEWFLDISIMMYFGAIHVGIAGFLSSPFLFFGRKRAQWQSWELLAFVVPYSVWASWMILDGTNKSLGNLGEFFVISVATPIFVLVRVVVGARKRQWLWSTILILLLCGVAVGTYVLTPIQPE